MLKKILFIIFFFYIFALLQNSFFIHFNFFGSAPNLIFVFFFLLVFFEKDNFYQIIFLGFLAGLFLDFFSYNYIGPSIVLLIVIGLLAKKTQLLLKNMENKFPFVYFLPIFLVSSVAYQILAAMSFDLRIIVQATYNLFFAIIGFSIFKKITNVKKIQG